MLLISFCWNRWNFCRRCLSIWILQKDLVSISIPLEKRV